MTAIDKQAAIADLRGLRNWMVTEDPSDGVRTRIASLDLAISALEADDGRELLETCRRLCVLRMISWTAADDARSQDFRDGIEKAASDIACAISRLAAEPAPIAEPAAPAGDDDGYRSLDHAMQILRGCVAPYSGEQAQAVAKVLKQWQEKWKAAVDLIRPEPAAPHANDEARIAEWDEDMFNNGHESNLRARIRLLGTAMMRSLLARAVKAEAERDELVAVIKASHNGYGETGRELGWSEPASPLVALKELIGEQGALADLELRKEIADLRAKLAAAEKERDAAIAAQNAKAVEELEAVRGYYLGAYVRHAVDERLAALRSSPTAAPAGEAPAQGAGDDVLREAMNPLLIYLQRPGETLTDAKVRHLQSVAAELCRRELARGER